MNKNAQFQKLVTFQITSFTELLLTPQHILNVTSVISCLLLTEIIRDGFQSVFCRGSGSGELTDLENWKEVALCKKIEIFE